MLQAVGFTSCKANSRVSSEQKPKKLWDFFFVEQEAGFSTIKIIIMHLVPHGAKCIIMGLNADIAFSYQSTVTKRVPGMIGTIK